MNKEQNMEEHLWDYIDGLAGAEERSRIDALIAGDREWQLKYTELMEIRQAFQSEELETPSLRFSKNVMEEIARHHISPAANTYINKNIIRGIGAFFGITIGGMLIYALVQLKGSGDHSILTTGSYDQVLKQRLNGFNWGMIFNNTMNIFIMVNLILGLMFLNLLLEKKKRQAGSH